MFAPPGDRHHRLALEPLARRVGLHAGNRQCACGLEDRTRIGKDILDGRADRIGVHEDDLVDILAAEPEGLLADLPDCGAIRKQADVVQLNAPSGRERARHRVRIESLHTDHADLGCQRLEVGTDAGGESTPADRDEHGMDRPVVHRVVLAQDLHRDRALPGDHVRVVERVHEGEVLLRLHFECMRVGIGIRVAEQDHVGAARPHRLDLDLRRGHRHDDDGAAAELLRRQRHALRVIAGRCRDDAALQLRTVEPGHLVVSAAQLEALDRLQVLALEQHAIVECDSDSFGASSSGDSIATSYTRAVRMRRRYSCAGMVPQPPPTAKVPRRPTVRTGLPCWP